MTDANSNRTVRPKVSVNFAMTWDGRISTRNRTPADFSSKRDKRRLLEIRSEADAVLVGAKTVEADAMTLGMPDADLRAARASRGQAEYPLRVLASNTGRIDPGLRVFQSRFSPIALFSTERMPVKTRKALAGKADLHLDAGATVDLSGMLNTLHSRYGVRTVDCEGGGTLFRSLLEAGLVDAINLTLCPRIFGGGVRAATLTGFPGHFLPRSVTCSLQAMEVIEGECFLRYRVLKRGPIGGGASVPAS